MVTKAEVTGARSSGEVGTAPPMRVWVGESRLEQEARELLKLKKQQQQQRMQEDALALFVRQGGSIAHTKRLARSVVVVGGQAKLGYRVGKPAASATKLADETLAKLVARLGSK